MARIIVAEHAGACYGVERALEMTYAAARDAAGPVHTLGPLIHNPIVVADLERHGVGLADAPEDVDGGTVIIRTHGVVPEVVERACARGLDVVDATCPYVKKVHAAARRLVREGYQLIVVGEGGHPEVEGILGHAGPGAVAVSDVDELSQVELAEKVGVVVQTTQTAERLATVVAAIAPKVRELKIVNTICAATSERQRAASALAATADVMVVVGGKNSGNTRRLAEICVAACPATHHIERAEELEASWFDGARTIGVTAGASTPAEHIRIVVDAITGMVDAA